MLLSRALRPLAGRQSAQAARVCGVRSLSTATIDKSSGSIDVKWKDGTSSRFHPRWLRDACYCQSCVHPHSGQKLFSPADLPQSEFVPVKASVTPPPEGVHVSPFDGRLPDKASVDAHSLMTVVWDSKHVSAYPLAMLREHSSGLGGVHLPTPIPWGSEIGDDLPSVEFKDYMAPTSNAGLKRALRHVAEKGICFIRNVPRNEGRVASLGERIGSVRDTFYGRVWDVVSTTNAINIAYTSLHLGLHQDLLYFETPPGLQILHCLEFQVSGGDSLFMDGLKAAEVLRAESQAHYDTLSRIPVTYNYRNSAHHRRFRHPIIVPPARHGLDVGAVHFAPPFQGPMEFDRAEDIDPFYDAYKAFSMIVRRQSLMLQLRMKEGDAVIFNNRRVLHGRTAFDSAMGRRHLQGSYVDLDDFLSKVRVLLCRPKP